MKGRTEESLTINFIHEQADEILSKELVCLRERITIDVVTRLAVKIMSDITCPVSNGSSMDSGQDDS